MAKRESEIDLVLQLRNEMAAEMRKAEQQIRDQAKREEQRAFEEQRAAVQRERSAMEHLRSLSQIAVAAGAARLAISGMNIATQLVSGDMDAAADAASRIPFGLGGAVREGRELWQTLSGARAETERMDNIMRDQLAAESRRFTEAVSRREQEKAHAQLMLQIEREIAVLRADPSDRAAMEAQFADISEIEDVTAALDDLAQKEKELRRELANNEELQADRQRLIKLTEDLAEEVRSLQNIRATHGGEAGVVRAHERIVANIAKERDAVIERISAEEAGFETLHQRREQLIAQREQREERQHAQGMERIRADMQAQAEAVSEQMRRQAEAEQEHLREAQRVREQITRMELEDAGEVLQAQLHAIRTAGEERERAAREAGNVQLEYLERERTAREAMRAEAEHARRQEIEAIREQMEAVQQRINEQSQQSQRSPGMPGIGTANQDRFLTGVRQQTEQGDRQAVQQRQQQIKAQNDQLNKLQSMENLLREQLQETRDAPTIRFVSNLN